MHIEFDGADGEIERVAKRSQCILWSEVRTAAMGDKLDGMFH
jgi:hypothetical protein